jgi:hypothetical protein
MPVKIESFNDFIASFLVKRNLTEPDGRPLYEYKISDGRYQALKVLLTHKWEENSFCYAAFVLYAVEFLRLESDEGHLRWDSIFESIGKGHLNTAQIRIRIVEPGLNYWKRAIFIGQHREFLETLRFESGLPNSSLSDNNNLSSLIHYTFGLIETYRMTESDLIPLIEERIAIYSIPQVLRQETFYQLVTKLCFKFLKFKQNFNLANQSNPTEYLQTQLTDWRAEMPLKIEGERMNNFFNNIISNISKPSKIEPIALTFETILNEKTGLFSLSTYINIPKGTFGYEAFGLIEEDFEKLPVYFCLNLEIGEKTIFLTGFNKLTNGRISVYHKDKIPLPGDCYEKEWVLSFTSENKEIRIVSELSKFHIVSFQDPLVFVEEESGNWVFKGQAPLKLKESACRVVIDPSSFSISDHSLTLGQFKNGLEVYEVDSDVSIIEEESQTAFWVKLAQENEFLKVLDFAPKLFPEIGSFDFLAENEHIFLGIPRVSLVNKAIGLKEIFSSTIEVFDQEKKWEIFNPSVVGKRKFRFKDRNGNILGVKTLNILPADFKITVNQRAKTLVLSSLTNFKIFLLRNGINTEINPTGNSIEINIDASVDESVNAHINIGLNFNSLGIINLKIPNPNFTEVFVNGDGKVVERVSYSLSKIYGLSIINNNYTGVVEKKIYTLKLNDIHNRDASALEIKKELLVEPFSRNRKALYQWNQQINQLFSLSSNTRATVRVSSAKPHHYIEISKYDCELVYDGTTGLLSVDRPGEPFELTLSAFRLDMSFNPKDLVTIKLTQNTHNFLESLPSDGTWFVFSNPDTAMTIVPKVIIKGEKIITPNEGPIEFLFEASFLDFEKRISRFKEFFDNQYLNFQDPVWEELYNLFKTTEHLPISALDVWKGLIKSPKGMLTFFFSEFSEPSLFKKVSQELGFIWHFIPVYRWEEAFNNWSVSILNSENNSQFFEIFKSTKFNEIKNELGLYGLIEHFNHEHQTINIQLLTFLLSNDINGENGKLGVRARHSGDVFWASYAGDFVVEKFNLLPEDLKSALPKGLPLWQKPVIYLPVILAYQSVNSSFIKLYDLEPEVMLGIKLNMDFDREYFDDVYSKVQGFCLTQYYKETKES